MNIYSLTGKKKKLLLLSEEQLLKGLTAKKLHADEVGDTHLQEIESVMPARENFLESSDLAS